MTGGIVVVLGPTGRNFAAGMTGGVAYVLDDAGDFDARCNRELVGLEPVEDDEELRALVAEHLARTGSAVAARLLADWDPSCFVTVMPHDYRRALELGVVSTGGDGFYTTESEEALA
jgi:glutamate synthase domain-containing protein 3